MSSRNFGVICCMSCKAFFRRKAFSDQKLICLSNDNCIVNEETRNNCQKCRLDKCFAVGMHKEIMHRKVSKTFSTSSSLTSVSDESQDDLWELIDDIIDSDCNTDSSDDVFALQVMDINTTDTALVPISKPLTDYNGLKQLEFQRISELITASTVFTRPLGKNVYQIKDRQECLRMLSAIILFNPNLPNLIHRDIIRLEQQLYIYLLQRYLLLKYRSESESQTKLQTFMTSLKDLEIMSEIRRSEPIESYANSNSIQSQHLP
ncbi:unnamed protein product [Medioppia subpectinata]|uniref:Nuclear receptor domain-containing protein n=1 Tax=Medioppia subpectinata TaxID=1979941 RepID=A0A7R9KTP1_9ACAR|nr:unnamed protein product [Medioppia subpectinata]CAG2109623.1 unnamed protein product [Medioppia subpectinata]